MVTFSDGKSELFDEVIFATGYCAHLPDFIEMDVKKKPDGHPLITPSCESVSIKGLYFTGPLASGSRRCAFIHCFRPMVEPMALEIAERLGY